MTDMSCLREARAYWDEWRFLPWSDGAASGLYRRADFIKAGLFGEVGRYQADDYIVWRYEDDDVERLFRSSRPAKDLMLSRYVFVRPEGGATVFKNKSFCLGLKGFVEVYLYSPLAKRPKQIADLGYLVDASYRYWLGLPKKENGSSEEKPLPQTDSRGGR